MNPIIMDVTRIAHATERPMTKNFLMSPASTSCVLISSLDIFPAATVTVKELQSDVRYVEN